MSSSETITYTYDGGKYEVPSYVSMATGVGYNTEDVISASLLAYEFNNENYVKREGIHEYRQIVDKDGQEHCAYVTVALSNACLVRWMLMEEKELLEIKREDAKTLIADSAVEFAFETLSKDMGDFETKVYELLEKEELHRSEVGLASFIPTFIKNRDIQRKASAETLNSEWIGSVGDKVELEINVVRANRSHEFGGFNITGYTVEGNAVSFFTSKNDFENVTGETIKISAKVKKHQTLWKDKDVKETRLNYVKLIS